MTTTLPTVPNADRDWELTCDNCDGDGFVYVERRVGPCQTDIQTFKEECECCEGRGFVFAFEDIPGIAEYVKSCRPATVAPGDAQDERQADACPRCDGSGEITVMSDSSPDAHDVVLCCDHCQGSGAATDAAKYLAAALSGEKYRHMQLWAEYRNFHRSLCARFGYGHDEVHFRRDLVSLEEAIAAKVAAPAAGDALNVLLLTQALQELRQAFVIAVGDKSPFARIALGKADAAMAASQQQEG